MPLEAPELDNRTFEQLVQEARLRIPRYTPEWTDFNESDPGMTLVELFAWLTEMMLHQLNQVPERNYLKFLQMLNLELRPAQPALAHLTFSPKSGAEVNAVLARSRIAAQPPGGEQVIFETTSDLYLVRVPLSDVQVYDGTAYSVVSPANDAPGIGGFHPLGWVPQVGNTLYLGFAQTNPPARNPVFPQEIRLRVFQPVKAQAGLPQSSRELAQPPAPPVTLAWEYKPDDKTDHWRRLRVYRDESAAFTREGYILLEGPGKITPTTIPGKIKEPRFWLRCRLIAGAYPAGQVPELDFIRVNTVPAENLSTVRDEFLGRGDGRPGQLYSLRYKPVQPDSIQISILSSQDETKDWTVVDDFLASGPQDQHYILNATRGEIRFGDGQHGLIPVAGVEIVARQYRYGGGKAGNVGSGQITAPLTQMSGVDKVTNESPAVGGGEEQKVEELKAQAPRLLRSRNRAVSAEDYTALALEAGGVAKATALALAHPAHPGVEVPGCVTVVIVPATEDMPPKPSPALLAQVSRYLDSRRLLTTELYLCGPTYQAIKVEARLSSQPYASSDQVASQVVKALNNYLNPLGSGPDSPGWEFGRNFYPTNLYGIILKVADVVAVRSLSISVNGQPLEQAKLTQAVEVPPGGLVWGVSDHEITVEPADEF